MFQVFNQGFIFIFQHFLPVCDVVYCRRVLSERHESDHFVIFQQLPVMLSIICSSIDMQVV